MAWFLPHQDYHDASSHMHKTTCSHSSKTIGSSPGTGANKQFIAATILGTGRSCKEHYKSYIMEVGAGFYVRISLETINEINIEGADARLGSANKEEGRD